MHRFPMVSVKYVVVGVCLVLLLSTRAPAISQDAPAGQSWIRVSDDQRSFVNADTGQAFVPWGFNYDHDAAGRLIEDYWETEWASVEGDFQEMKDLGATVVRIHIQFGKFMAGPNAPNQQALQQLGRLVGLAEQLQIYVDLTGLGCYHKQDVPAWYDQLDEAGRWVAQAQFWEAVSAACTASPALFCYDIMNEPVVPGGEQAQENWLGPPFAGKHFVQFITRDRCGRSRPQIARQWIDTMVAAIRKHDTRHLITVGFVDWSLDRPGLTSGFVPQQVAESLDFVAVHVYPEKDKITEALDTIRGFGTGYGVGIGKPVVIEETFPLRCSFDDMTRFLTESRGSAAGWISFYWGRTADEYRRSEPHTIGDAIMARWLETFPKQMASER